MNNEQVGHYVKSLGILISQVGEYLRALDEKAEIEQQHHCLDKIQQQLDQLQQQTLYIFINSLEERQGDSSTF